MVELTFMQSLLRDGGIESVILDSYMSAAQGSISAIEQRLMVPGEDFTQACRILDETDMDYGREKR